MNPHTTVDHAWLSVQTIFPTRWLYPLADEVVAVSKGVANELRQISAFAPNSCM